MPQESNTASSSQPLPQDLLPTFKSACDLGKQESKHTAVIDVPEQRSETTFKTAKLPCVAGKTWDFKKLLLERFREEAFQMLSARLGRCQGLLGQDYSCMRPQAAVNAPKPCSCRAICSAFVGALRQQTPHRQARVNFEVQDFAMGLVRTSQALCDDACPRLKTDHFTEVSRSLLPFSKLNTQF